MQVLAGRLEEAARTTLESVRVGDELGLRRRKGVWCRCDAAHVHVVLGDLARAEALLEEARGLDPQGVDAFRTDLEEGHLRLRQGRLDDARALLERGRTASERLLDPQLLAPLYAALVETATWQDDDAAGALVAEGLARFDATTAPHAVWAVELLGAAVRWAVVTGRPGAEAGAWGDRAAAAQRASRFAAPQSVAHLASIGAELGGEPAAWEQVIGCWDRLGDRYRAADVRIRAAETVLAAGGDRGLATTHLREAVARARAVGAEHLLARAADLGRRSRLVVDERPADNPYRLTGREREVLALVAQGLTDRQVGTRLFISHRTVERHVSNLLAKLGAGRRSELVATAHREGLVDT